MSFRCAEHDDPRVKNGSDYLLAHLQSGSQWFTYGCFYAAPAQYMIGRQTWGRWYYALKTTLLANVRRDGAQAYRNKHLEPGSPGSIYSTAVDMMILAMPNHYLPLHQR